MLLSSLLAASAATLPVPQAQRPAGPPKHVAAPFELPFVIDHPCGIAGSRFGESTVALDFDGDGVLEIAVGAWGEGLVYVLFGPADLPGKPPYSEFRLFDAAGPKLCPRPPSSDRFGYDVAAGQLDADATTELVVGAPFHDAGGFDLAGGVFLFGMGPNTTTPYVLTAAEPEDGYLGNSVIVGDFDGDGHQDVAAAAPKDLVAGVSAGAVHVFFGPFDAVNGASGELVVDNPAPVVNGNFGQHLSVHDGNGDGLDDLCVSAIGNTVAGLPLRGQVYVFPGPLTPTSYFVAEDPTQDPNDLPSPRFGMTIDARANLLAVGANRKDLFGLHDVGQGYVYSGPGYSLLSLHRHPDPRPSDYFAFRAMIANVVGDATLDVTFAVLPNPHDPDPNVNALLVFDGTDLQGAPLVVPGLARSGSHFANGISYAQLIPGGYEELIVGDPSYDAVVTNPADNTGRVVIHGDF